MAELAERFPDCISFGAFGGWPSWLVTIVQHAGNVETRNLDDPTPRGRWNFANAVKELSDHQQVYNHFIKARGQFHTFRFKDWGDFECDRFGDARGRLVGAGMIWQMSKVYGADEPSFEYVRDLERIVALTESIWRNGVLQVRGADYTIDNNTGEVTSAISWTGATLEMSCEFDVPCRYDVSRLDVNMVSRAGTGDLIVQWSDVDIVEEIVDEDEVIS